MKHTFIFKKAIVWAGMIFLATMILSPQKIFATCTPGIPWLECNHPAEYCNTSDPPPPYTASGLAVYNCSSYYSGDCYGIDSCWRHTYTCDTSCGGGGGGASPSPSPSPGCEDNTPVMDIKIDNGDGPAAYSEPAGYTVTWLKTNGDNPDSCSIEENGVQFSTTANGSQTYSNKMQGSYDYSASCENCGGTGADTATANVSGRGMIQGRRVNGSCLDIELFDGNPQVNNGAVPVTIYEPDYVTPTDYWDLNSKVYTTLVGGVGMGETYTVSVVEPPGYDAYYSVCENCIDHPDGFYPYGSYVRGNSVNVIVPLDYYPGENFAYVDLYWKYVPQTMTVSGKVVKDPDRVATPHCGDTGMLCGFPISCTDGYNWTEADGGGFNITVSGCNNVDAIVKAVDINGNYDTGVDLLYSPWHTVTISPSPGWINSCPEVGIYSYITSTVGDNYANFYVTEQKPAWWQAEAGNIHADGGDIRSAVPDTADEPYLITGSQAGLVSYSGDLDIGSGTINQKINSNWQALTSYQGLMTDYGYFKRILEDDPVDFLNWNGFQPEADGVYAVEGDMATLEAFAITNEKIVILVDGSVSIDYDISVAEDEFLAIISSGNITIDNSVTNVQGVYIANGTISSGTANTQLIGEGIFTGWQGIILQRDFGDTTNNTTPVERFIYRPDLVRNAYTYLLKPMISWREVAP